MISDSFPEFVHDCFAKSMGLSRLLAKMIKWHRILFNLCWLRLSPIIREEQPGKPPLTGPASKIFTLPTEYFPAYAAKKRYLFKTCTCKPHSKSFLDFLTPGFRSVLFKAAVLHVARSENPFHAPTM